MYGIASSANSAWSAMRPGYPPRPAAAVHRTAGQTLIAGHDGEQRVDLGPDARAGRSGSPARGRSRRVVGARGHRLVLDRQRDHHDLRRVRGVDHRAQCGRRSRGDARSAGRASPLSSGKRAERGEELDRPVAQHVGRDVGRRGLGPRGRRRPRRRRGCAASTMRSRVPTPRRRRLCSPTSNASPRRRAAPRCRAGGARSGWGGRAARGGRRRGSPTP